MKNLLQVNIKRVYIYLVYITNKTLRWLIALIIAITFMYSLMILSAIPSIAVGPTTPSYDIYPGTIILLMVIEMVIAFIPSTVIDEIERGETTLFLAHSLKRNEYLFAWILALLLFPLALILSHILTLVIIYPPQNIALKLIENMLYMSIQIVELIVLLFSISIITRRKNLSVVIGIIIAVPLLFLLPFAGSMLQSTNDPIWYTLLVPIAILKPYTYHIFTITSTSYPYPYRSIQLPSTTTIYVIAIVLTIAIAIATFIRFMKIDL
ncbi:hypothetical protein Igag_0973 [Ignisphaera aggregans DSM 17230]|uniref:ABC transporter permease n=1 Tax=Ignisphaera aggregans (strain DSM 17230 / JCM 13409 / AQ1.S1) TaxID=583356 RepID=E0SNJ2_IGNAA|nr:hypothetical protein Igag_0973 [Ignisphaera aggregans DSM 17230]